MRIELTYPAWKAGVLPLNYTRIISDTSDIISQVRDNCKMFLKFFMIFFMIFSTLFSTHSDIAIRETALRTYRGCSYRTQEWNPESYSITGSRLMFISVKISYSSKLGVLNSDITAPSGPAWNQCLVSGCIVYCSPAWSTISWNTV